MTYPGNEIAKQAFDIQMRHGWNPMKLPGGGWIVEEMDGSQRSPGTYSWPDPFTALVEADRWYRKENLEK